MLNLLSNKTNSYISIIDKKYRFRMVSLEYLVKRGISSKLIINKTLNEVWGNNTFNTTIKKCVDTAFAGKSSSIQKWFKFSPISKRFYNVQYSPLYNLNNNPVAVVVITTDLTNKKELERKISNELYKDALTSAYNKKLFAKDFITMVKSRQPFQILYFDLDNFKNVNDTYGHAAGDNVLISIVDLIKSNCRNSDNLYRLGGDEFSLIISSELFSKEELTDKVQQIINQLKSASFNKKYKVGVSVGILSVMNTHSNPKEILHTVDQLMYKSKKSGKNTYSYEEA